MSRTRHHGNKAKEKLFGKNWQWSSQTPKWWVKTMMTAPQRRGVRDWERNASRTAIEELDSLDNPPHGHKPHVYYW